MTIPRKIRDLPLPALFWKAPKPSDTGDANEAVIWMAVGRALSKWEAIEEHMAGLFEALTQTHSLAARRAYGSLVGGMNDMLLSAAEAHA